MVSFNRVVLAGNLTRDPELRVTPNGVPVCSFSIAVNRVRSKSEAVDYFNVSCWRELGETVANYKKKGDPILVEAVSSIALGKPPMEPSEARWTWLPIGCSS
jgi:single-strand DNA-binding protein